MDKRLVLIVTFLGFFVASEALGNMFEYTFFVKKFPIAKLAFYVLFNHGVGGWNKDTQ